MFQPFGPTDTIDLGVTPDNLRAYCEAVETAGRAFCEATTPARNHYYDVDEKEWDAYVARYQSGAMERDESRALYNQNMDEARKTLAEAETEPRKAMNAAIRAAQDVLFANVENPVLREFFIQAMNTYDYETRIVLDALPCTLTVLDRLAENEGWCDAWGTMRSGAFTAGLVTEAYHGKCNWRSDLCDCEKCTNPDKHNTLPVCTMQDTDEEIGEHDDDLPEE